MRHQLRISRRDPSTRLGCVRDPCVFYVATQERQQSIFGFYACICSLYHAFLSLHYYIHTPHSTRLHAKSNVFNTILMCRELLLQVIGP